MRNAILPWLAGVAWAAWALFPFFLILHALAPEPIDQLREDLGRVGWRALPAAGLGLLIFGCIGGAARGLFTARKTTAWRRAGLAIGILALVLSLLAAARDAAYGSVGGFPIALSTLRLGLALCVAGLLSGLIRRSGSTATAWASSGQRSGVCGPANGGCRPVASSRGLRRAVDQESDRLHRGHLGR